MEPRTNVAIPLHELMALTRTLVRKHKWTKDEVKAFNAIVRKFNS